MFKKILVATDFSEDSDAALSVAVNLARTETGTIELVHVYRHGVFVLPPPLDLGAWPLMGATLGDIEGALETRAKQARAKGVAVTVQALVGAPAEAIVERARERGADLIVLGARGLSAAARPLLGSVAEKVVRHAPCAILVIPQEPRPA